MKRFKSYGFWTAFAGAFIVLLNAVGDLFGFKIESKLVENVILAVAGVLVAVGVVSMDTKKEDITDDKQEKLPAEEDAGQEVPAEKNDADKEEEAEKQDKN